MARLIAVLTGTAVLLLANPSLPAGVVTTGEPMPARPTRPAKMHAATRPAKPMAPSVPGVVVYRSLFGKGGTDGWSSDKPLPIDKAGGTLGRLHNQTVRLTLSKIPRHTFLHLRLDLHVIESWDGTFVDTDGPDTVTIRLRDGRTLLHASFSTAGGEQSYPDNDLWAAHPRRTGEAARFPGVDFEGSLYRLALTFPHTSSQAVLDFTAKLTERQAKDRNADNESWALGSVVVSALPKAPVTLDGKRFAELWAHLADKDPIKAQRVAWTLISAGRTVVPRIGRSLRLREDKATEKKIAELIRQLDKDDWRVRQEATRELTEIGAGAHGQIRRTLADKPSLEVKSRIEHILGSHEAQPAETRRLARTRWVLQVLGGGEARALLDALPEPKPAEPSRPDPTQRRGDLFKTGRQAGTRQLWTLY